VRETRSLGGRCCYRSVAWNSSRRASRSASGLVRVSAPKIDLPKGGGAIRGIAKSSAPTQYGNQLHVGSDCGEFGTIRIPTAAVTLV
jgi:hypothetical protein